MITRRYLSLPSSPSLSLSHTLWLPMDKNTPVLSIFISFPILSAVLHPVAMSTWILTHLLSSPVLPRSQSVPRASLVYLHPHPWYMYICICICIYIYICAHKTGVLPLFAARLDRGICRLADTCVGRTGPDRTGALC